MAQKTKIQLMEATLLGLIKNEIIEIRNNLQMLSLNDEINSATESNIKTILRKRIANGIIESSTLRAHAEAIILCLKKTRDYPLFSKYDFNDKNRCYISITLGQEISGFENTKQSSNSKESTFLRAKERLLRDLEKSYLVLIFNFKLRMKQILMIITLRQLYLIISITVLLKKFNRYDADAVLIKYFPIFVILMVSIIIL